jgi:hypothetical protein
MRTSLIPLYVNEEKEEEGEEKEWEDEEEKEKEKRRKKQERKRDIYARIRFNNYSYESQMPTF